MKREADGLVVGCEAGGGVLLAHINPKPAKTLVAFV
jgi:hypothetical protein